MYADGLAGLIIFGIFFFIVFGVFFLFLLLGTPYIEEYQREKRERKKPV